MVSQCTALMLQVKSAGDAEQATRILEGCACQRSASALALYCSCTHIQQRAFALAALPAPARVAAAAHRLPTPLRSTCFLRRLTRLLCPDQPVRGPFITSQPVRPSMLTIYHGVPTCLKEKREHLIGAESGRLGRLHVNAAPARALAGHVSRRRSPRDPIQHKLAAKRCADRV